MQLLYKKVRNSLPRECPLTFFHPFKNVTGLLILELVKCNIFNSLIGLSHFQYDSCLIFLFKLFGQSRVHTLLSYFDQIRVIMAQNY